LGIHANGHIRIRQYKWGPVGTTTLPATFEIQVVDDGITFGFSYNGDAGAAVLEHNPNLNGGALIFSDISLPVGSKTLALQPIAPTPSTLFSGPMSINLTMVSGSWNVTFVGSTPLQSFIVGSITSPTVVTAPAGTYSKVVFSFTGPANILRINDITVQAPCFCTGTRIATPGGFKNVEDLVAGDELLTAAGDVTSVTWLGWRKVDVRFSKPSSVNPICISKDALMPGVPERDLWVSEDHAIEIDGSLYHAGLLVNGTTIYRVVRMPPDGFTYYHIETRAHELILAENLPAETYVNHAVASPFDNADSRDAGRVVAEMDLPRITAARLVPESLRARLAESGIGNAA
jgi:hypothetical protein